MFPKQRILTMWNQVIFRGEIGSLDKSAFIATCTQAYEADLEVYIREIKAAYADFMSLFDVNMNRMMEMEEHVRFFKIMGFTSSIQQHG